MTNIEELLPCPFCGGEALVDNLIDDDDYSVRCLSCEIQQIANYTRPQAIRRWNRRVKVYQRACEGKDTGA